MENNKVDVNELKLNQIKAIIELRREVNKIRYDFNSKFNKGEIDENIHKLIINKIDQITNTLISDVEFIVE